MFPLHSSRNRLPVCTSEWVSTELTALHHTPKGPQESEPVRRGSGVLSVAHSLSKRMVFGRPSFLESTGLSWTKRSHQRYHPQEIRVTPWTCL